MKKKMIVKMIVKMKATVVATAGTLMMMKMLRYLFWLSVSVYM